jgi:hypothetical protein
LRSSPNEQPDIAPLFGLVSVFNALGRFAWGALSDRIDHALVNVGYFGTWFMGLNYCLIFSAWGFVGLVGPLLVTRVKDPSGSFAAMLPYFARAFSMAAILPLITKKPPDLAPVPRTF